MDYSLKMFFLVGVRDRGGERDRSKGIERKKTHRKIEQYRERKG